MRAAARLETQLIEGVYRDCVRQGPEVARDCIERRVRYSEIHHTPQSHVPAGKTSLSSRQAAQYKARTKLYAHRTRLVPCTSPRPPPSSKCPARQCPWTVILLKEHT